MEGDLLEGAKLTLHCFAGDTQSLAVILLADFLGLRLAVRYLKPINLTEKLYKQTLTKTFPLLQFERPGVPALFLERSPAILRFLARLTKTSDDILSPADPFRAAVSDQLLDSLHQDILPSAFLLQAIQGGIVESDPAIEKQALADLKSALTSLDKSLSAAEKFPVLLSDFLLFAADFALSRHPAAETALAAAPGLRTRLARCAEEPRFARATTGFRRATGGSQK